MARLPIMYLTEREYKALLKKAPAKRTEVEIAAIERFQRMEKEKDQWSVDPCERENLPVEEVQYEEKKERSLKISIFTASGKMPSGKNH